MYKKVILTVCVSLLTTFTKAHIAEITPQPSLREKIVRLIKKNPRMFLTGGSLTTLALWLLLREKQASQQSVATPVEPSKPTSVVINKPQPRATHKPDAKKPAAHTTTNQQPLPIEEIPETAKLSDQGTELTEPRAIPIKEYGEIAPSSEPEAVLPTSTASSLNEPAEPTQPLTTASIIAHERPVSPPSVPLLVKVDEYRPSTPLLISQEKPGTGDSLSLEPMATPTAEAPTTSQSDRRIEKAIPNKDPIIDRSPSVPLIDKKSEFRPTTPPLPSNVEPQPDPQSPPIESAKESEAALMPEADQSRPEADQSSPEAANKPRDDESEEAVITHPFQGHPWTCTHCGKRGNFERSVECRQCKWWHCRSPQCAANESIDKSKEECIECCRIRCHICSVEVQGPTKETCCTTCGNPLNLTSAYPLTLADEALTIMNQKGVTPYTSLSEKDRTPNPSCFCGQCRPPIPDEKYLDENFQARYKIIKQYALEPRQTTLSGSKWHCGMCGTQNEDKSELKCSNEKCLAWRCETNCPHANSPFQIMCPCKHPKHWQCPTCHTITLGNDSDGMQGSKRCPTKNAYGHACNTWVNFDPRGNPESKEYWTCTECQHHNKRNERWCQGITDGGKICNREADESYLRVWVSPNTTLDNEKKQFGAAFGDAKLSMFAQQYIEPHDPRLCSIEEAAENGEERYQNGGCIIVCPRKNIVLCQSDGYCGWHAITGFFQGDYAQMRATLACTRETTTPHDIWLNNSDTPRLANLIKRRIFTFHQCGYTDNGLCFSLSEQRGDKYKGHPPIMLIQWPNHYDRIIANNTYEQFIFPDFMTGFVIDPDAIAVKICQYP